MTHVVCKGYFRPMCKINVLKQVPIGTTMRPQHLPKMVARVCDILTDQRTDKADYRDARTHLKRIPPVEGPDVDCIPEGIAELKKQTQFTEHWKRKYGVTLNCYFTTVSRLCMKSMPEIKGCKGIIVVKILITNNDPRHPKLSSILHTPVLQWHGIDIKLQLPKFLPLNLWEGEHTTYAFYQPEASTNRGFCTVTGKIGQEQILLEEELRFGNPIPLDEWKSLSKDLEGHMEKYLKTTRKKIRTSADRTSLRDSHDTGYLSEQQPYPTLRYTEHDTDSDQDLESQRQKDQRYKARRKDTPHYGRPIIKGSPKGFNIPLIEELEMNPDSSEDHADQYERKEGISDEKTDSTRKNDQDAPSRRSSNISFINKRKSSSKSICLKSSEDLGAVPKRKSRSLVDLSHPTDNLRELSPSIDVASFHSAEKCVVRQRRKKKSLTSKLMKEKSVNVGAREGVQCQDEVIIDVKVQSRSIDDAHDADDEDECKKESRKNSQNEDQKTRPNASGHNKENQEVLNKSYFECVSMNPTLAVSDCISNTEQTPKVSVCANKDAQDETMKVAKLLDCQRVIKQAVRARRVVEILKENSSLTKANYDNDQNEIAKQCDEDTIIDTNDADAEVEAYKEECVELTESCEPYNEALEGLTNEHQEQMNNDRIELGRQESVSDEVKLNRVTKAVVKVRKLQNIAAAFNDTHSQFVPNAKDNDDGKPLNTHETESTTIRRTVNETMEYEDAPKGAVDVPDMLDSGTLHADVSSSFQVSNKSPVRPKAESFSATERRTPSPRKHYSLCTSEMKAQFMKKREEKTTTQPPPLSGAKSFCE